VERAARRRRRAPCPRRRRRCVWHASAPRPAERHGMTHLGWPRVVAALIGVGLALAPVGFRMFERAPKGGDMIVGFRPYMKESKIDSFRAELATIGRARAEAATLPAQRQGTGATATFVRQWPSIDDDMGSMLRTMQHNIGHYDGVAALPPFRLFPWFFVIPGVLV